MASLLGYAMYQNHQAFGIDLLPGAAKPVFRRPVLYNNNLKYKSNLTLK